MLGPLRDDVFNLLVLGAKHGGKRRFASNQVLFLGVERDTVLRLVRLVLGSLRLRPLLSLLDVGLVQEELAPTLVQLVLGSPQILSGLGKPALHLSDTLLEVCLGLVHGHHPGVHLLHASRWRAWSLWKLTLMA